MRKLRIVRRTSMRTLRLPSALIRALSRGVLLLLIFLGGCAVGTGISMALAPPAESAAAPASPVPDALPHMWAFYVWLTPGLPDQAWPYDTPEACQENLAKARKDARVLWTSDCVEIRAHPKLESRT